MAKIKKEANNAATLLKKELIKELINKNIKYVDVINYYYDIIELNRQGEA